MKGDPSPKLLSGSRGLKILSLLRTLTNTGLYLSGFRAPFLTQYRSTEQFSTSLAFLGAQNLIGLAADITGQLLWLGSYSLESNKKRQYLNILKKTPNFGLSLHIPKFRTWFFSDAYESWKRRIRKKNYWEKNWFDLTGAV